MGCQAKDSISRLKWALLPLCLLFQGCFILQAPKVSDYPEQIERFTYRVEVAEEKYDVKAMRTRHHEGGDRVIIVPGSPGPMRFWSKVLAQSPADVEVITVERLGFFGSGSKRAVTALAGHAESILPLLDVGEGRRVILAGHSYGGPIIAKAVVMYPDQVDGLLILAGAFDPELERVLFIQRLGNRWGFRHIIPRWLRNANLELMALEGELRLLQPELATIQVPTVILHGTADTNVPYSNVDFLLRHLAPESEPEVITLEGANHFLDTQYPSDVVAAMNRLLERLDEGEEYAP